jgi:PQQ-dependent catabolism-associated CXXCW motif protein
VIAFIVRHALCIAGFLALGAAQAQAPFDEMHDFGVPPTTTLRLEDHASPTPRDIPGARPIGTAELRRLLQAPAETRPLLFDVLGGDGHATLPGTIWLPGAGRGQSLDDELQGRLAKALDFVTAGNRERMLVFFCSSLECWLSYNAALRAVRLGYGNVRWYRGGIQAWGAGGGTLTQPRAAWQRAPAQD